MKGYRFSARIEKADGAGAYVVFPYDVEKEFGTRGRVPVKVTFDGLPYAGSLVRCGAEQHMLGILKNIREQVGKGPGDMVDVELERDSSERIVDIPDDLAVVLKRERLRAAFDGLSYTNRREYCRWIKDAKRAETRSARLAKAVEMLRGGAKAPL
jgi:hypothetical protein